MKRSKKRKTYKRQNENEVISYCQKCGHPHVYPTLEALEQTSINTICNNCGYPFLKHLRDKMKATNDLLLSDPKARELLKAGKIKEFKDYFEKKTGLL